MSVNGADFFGRRPLQSLLMNGNESGYETAGGDPPDGTREDPDILAEVYGGDDDDDDD